MTLTKKIPNLHLYIGMALLLAINALSISKATDAERNARKAAGAVTVTAAKITAQNVSALNKKLCVLAVPSWEIRRQLILDTNEPSKLSPVIDPNSVFGKALQVQIDQTNAQRAARKVRDLALNGPKPC